MTDNHHLLYRLAELMLQQEQHILPVDLLFDDEQIGDFVKSIQIDSPYQQMLLEGVLTESVREEKLFVSFTVEGYFHYVLGEVIFNLIQGRDLLFLKDIIEKSALNGVVEGIQQCLIRDVKSNDLDRLINLIDLGGKNFSLCILPLSYAFVIDYSTSVSNGKDEHDFQKLVSKLLDKPTINDLKILLEVIKYLEKLLKNRLVFYVYNSLVDVVKSDSIEALKLLCNSIQYIPVESRLNKIDNLIFDLEKFKSHIEYCDILVELGSQYYLLESYEKAISCYIYAVDQLSIKYTENQDRLQKIYNNLGAAYWRIDNLELAKKYFIITFEICLDLYGKNDLTTSIANFNLGIIEASTEKYENALSIFNDVVKVELSFYGRNHVITARTYSNIGSVYLQLKDYESAYNYFSHALTIDTRLLNSFHSSIGLDYDDLGDVYLGLKDIDKAKFYYNKSLEIFVKNNGMEYSHTKLLIKKINEINDL